ncbi:MAG: HAD hydrolase-like protein [Candidatus Sungbacteria bacterium]|nr:HAD hydrolase-like protein [Candidatus Sungbacteria bacterium]
MIRVILVDGLFTIFVPKNGMSRYEMLQLLIVKFLGVRIEVDEIQPVYDAMRKKWEEILPPNHGEKWAIIDREILRALVPTISLANAALVGKKISHATLSDPDLYEILPDTRGFLRRAKHRGIRTVFASNQDKEKLQILIGAFGLGPLVNAVYVSTEIGHEKPSQDFFEAILRQENIRADECVMVGNNPHNDIYGAASVGIRGILYDRDNAYSDFSGHRVSRLSEVFEIDAIFGERR